jgi:hypothetical protein
VIVSFLKKELVGLRVGHMEQYWPAIEKTFLLSTQLLITYGRVFILKMH